MEGVSPNGPPVDARTSPATGLSAGRELVVEESDTAARMRTGEVPVLSTPRLIALCEEASCAALKGHLGVGNTSVASRVQFDHLVAVGVGATVRAEATLARVQGRRLTFKISVTLHSVHGDRLVGAGRLSRVIVDEAAFMSRCSGST